MYRDLWTLMIPMFAAAALVIAAGAALDFSSPTFGWAFLGAGGLVTGIWSATRPRDQH